MENFEKEIGTRGKKHTTIVGIIPVAQHTKIFNFPWDDSLIPVGKDYFAIEHSVVECANAGCESIWIICYNDTQLFLRQRVGEWIYDPMTFEKALLNKNNFFYKKRIPIYYIPIHPRDKGRRDCQGFSIAYGMWFAEQMYTRISDYTAPKLFYVSFPHGIMDVDYIKNCRKEIQKKRRLLFSHNDKTVFDNEPLSFTTFFTDVNFIMNSIREGKPKHYFDKSGKIKRYSKDEAYTAKNYTLSEALKYLDSEEAYLIKVPKFYNINNWEKYCDFLGKKNNLMKPEYFHYEEFHLQLTKEEEEKNENDTED